jgi:1,4-dihydroxy-2-naphthoyl-CoA hydrolase
MSIWTRPIELDALNALTRNTIAAQAGIRFVEIGPDFLRATMPVDARTHQPFGLLHGGASVVLAETLGSIAGHCAIRDGGDAVVGIEVNANHVRGVRDGEVTGTARPVHIGKTTQVWEIRIEDGQHRLVCLSRLTLSVLNHAPQPR